MSQHESEPDVQRLLEADRELSAEEQQLLTRSAERGWAGLLARTKARARSAYAVTTPEQLHLCISEHMQMQDWGALIESDSYECPLCHQLLKQRQAPVASAVLLERRRVRELWQEVEAADETERPERLLRFRRSLGLT